MVSIYFISLVSYGMNHNVIFFDAFAALPAVDNDVTADDKDDM